MPDLLILLGIVIVVLISVLPSWVKRPRRHRHVQSVPVLQGAKMIYSDHWKNTEPLLSERYKLKAKPDAIYQLNDGRYGVMEYKSRFGVIYDSDIAQLMASVICARSRYPAITVGVVQTNTHYKIIELPYDNDHLIGLIEGALRQARLAHQHIKPVITPVATKCQGCGMNHIEKGDATLFFEKTEKGTFPSYHNKFITEVMN